MNEQDDEQLTAAKSAPFERVTDGKFRSAAHADAWGPNADQATADMIARQEGITPVEPASGEELVAYQEFCAAAKALRAHAGAMQDLQVAYQEALRRLSAVVAP